MPVTPTSGCGGPAATSRVPLPTRATPDILLEDLCFDAQQAAEKAIKAVLVHRGIRFPKTHAIAELLSLAAENGVEV